MNKILLMLAAALTCCVSASADTATGTLDVEAVVLNSCSVATSPVVFANVELTSVNANGSVTVDCTNSGSFTVALDGGESADISARELTHDSSTSTFTYQLYTDSGRTTVWGDGTTGVTQSGSGPSQTFTVYGSTTSTPSEAGTYDDAVTVTVDF